MGIEAEFLVRGILPESNVVVRQPVILKGFDIFECEANIVIAEVGSVGV